MELKLQNLITQLTTISNIQEMDTSNAVAVRLSNTIAAKIYVIVCAINEPTNMVLPLNVAWLNLNPTSLHYSKILVRTSKDASSEYTYSWSEVSYYADVFVDQYYDDADTLLLTESSNIGNASDTVKGITYLSVAPADATKPIAVGDNDPRNSDARTPLPHSHPLLPAVALQTMTNVVTVNTGAAPVAGQVLYATSPTTAVWHTLTAADIH